MDHIDLKAILLATLAVFGIDFVSSTMLAHVFHLPVDGSDEQLRAAITALNANPHYLLAAVVLGTASSVVGGLLTTRMVKQLPYFNALGFGVLGVVIGTVMSAGVPMAWRVIGVALTIPAALWGAWLSRRLRPSRSA